MKVIFKEPLKSCMYLIEIENTLGVLLHKIGGSLLTLPVAEDIICLCDVTGFLKGLPENYLHHTFGSIVGNVIFCGVDEAGTFISLTGQQIEYIEKYIGISAIR